MLIVLFHLMCVRVPFVEDPVVALSRTVNTKRNFLVNPASSCKTLKLVASSTFFLPNTTVD